VQDWIRGVGQTQDPSTFWVKMKYRLRKARIELLPPCQKLPYISTDGKRYKLVVV
jgi:hypothetical protein